MVCFTREGVGVGWLVGWLKKKNKQQNTKKKRKKEGKEIEYESFSMGVELSFNFSLRRLERSVSPSPFPHNPYPEPPKQPPTIIPPHTPQPFYDNLPLNHRNSAVGREFKITLIIVNVLKHRTMNVPARSMIDDY